MANADAYHGRRSCETAGKRVALVRIQAPLRKGTTRLRSLYAAHLVMSLGIEANWLQPSFHSRLSRTSLAPSARSSTRPSTTMNSEGRLDARFASSSASTSAGIR